MPRDYSAIRARFRDLHKAGCFVIPNPWDVGSARLFQHMGFQALASTSSGFAWTIGRPDNGVACKEVLTHLAALCAAVELPSGSGAWTMISASTAEPASIWILAGVQRPSL